MELDLLGVRLEFVESVLRVGGHFAESLLGLCWEFVELSSCARNDL